MTYSSVYVRQIIEKVQDEHFAVILHNCGNSGQCTEAMVATGAKGYHFGNRIDMVEALKGCPSHTLVMGNLDPVGVLKMSSASQVAAQVAELLQRTADTRTSSCRPDATCRPASRWKTSPPSTHPSREPMRKRSRQPVFFPCPPRGTGDFFTRPGNRTGENPPNGGLIFHEDRWRWQTGPK